MNGDNPHLTGSLLQLCTRGLIFMTAKKTASKPAVNACMDRFVFAFTLTGIFLH